MTVLVAIMSLVVTKIVLFILSYFIDCIEDERFNCDYEEVGEDCSVCALDEIQWAIETGCRHRFCFDCLKDWLESQKKYNNSPSCPLCRADVSSISSISWKSSVIWWKTIVKRCHTAVRKFYNPEPQIPLQSLTWKTLVINDLSATLPKFVLLSIFMIYGQCFVAIYDFINAQNIEESGASNKTGEHFEKLTVMLIMYLMSASFLNDKFTRPKLVRFVNTDAV